MQLPFISALVARGWVSAAFGRYLEALIIGTAVSFVLGALDAAQAMVHGGSFHFNAENVLGAALTAAGMYLSKSYRDALTRAQEVARQAIADAEAQKELPVKPETLS